MVGDVRGGPPRLPPPGRVRHPQPPGHGVADQAGSSVWASSTQHTPAGNDPRVARAAASASLVFPVPPGPVRVTRRLAASRVGTTSSKLAVAAHQRGEPAPGAAHRSAEACDRQSWSGARRGAQGRRVIATRTLASVKW